ncbi:MAG: hypothetical protein V9E98_07040 [Candidatus Nanopelagicales bacterium]
MATHREPGRSVVRVHTPTVEENGWSNGHTCVEIVTDDMPFLVDSVSAALSSNGRGIHLVIHPQFDVRRDDTGNLLSLGRVDHGEDDAKPLDALSESWIHFDIDRESDRVALDELTAILESVLADVRASVEDWPPMVAEAGRRAEDMAEHPIPGVPEQDQQEAVSFLRWLADGNFTFLGHRRYDLAETEDGTALVVTPGSGAGILRGGDGSVRLLGTMPEAVRVRALEPDPLILTKANSRSTVHRSTYLDYVGVKVFDETRHGHRGGPVPRPLHGCGVQPEHPRHPGPARQGRSSAGDEWFRCRLAQRQGSAAVLGDLPARRVVPSHLPASCSTPHSGFCGFRNAAEPGCSGAATHTSGSCRAWSTCPATVTTRPCGTAWKPPCAMPSIPRTSNSVPGSPRVSWPDFTSLSGCGRDTYLPHPDHAVVEAELAAAARSWEDVFADDLLEAVGEEDATRLTARFGRCHAGGLQGGLPRTHRCGRHPSPRPAPGRCDGVEPLPSL